LPAVVDAREAARAAEEIDQTAAAETIEAPARTVADQVVLVIDDDPQARDLLRRTLEGEGYTVETADSGEAALERARELNPAVITLDVMMPSMDGWAVLRALKADPGLQQIPVVMVSIIHEKGMAFALGAADYLTKPVDRELLRLVVGKYVEASGPGDLLVVDDDPAARQLVRRTLEPSGWTVREAENGRDALDRVADAAPDLIVLDLMMPVLDGFGFLRELRRGEAGRAIPVIVLTAKEVTPEEKRFLEEQAELVVQKDADDLSLALDQIRDAVGRHTAPA
jgi:CheY-like chemotaxis protein